MSVYYFLYFYIYFFFQFSSMFILSSITMSRFSFVLFFSCLFIYFLRLSFSVSTSLILSDILFFFYFYIIFFRSFSFYLYLFLIQVFIPIFPCVFVGDNSSSFFFFRVSFLSLHGHPLTFFVLAFSFMLFQFSYFYSL